MKFNEQKGNLFELDKKYSLVHCISQDCAMGAGIAVQFDKTFKGMKNYCKRVIKENNLSFPVVIPFNEDNRCIFNLVTKKAYYGKPTYLTITKCIHNMVGMCKEFDIKYLAMPKIGCGLDRLQWGKVKEIIKEEFKNLDINIEVRYL